jgi:hypothetical protein
MSEITVEQAIGAIVALRAKKAALEAETKQKVAAVNAKMEKIEAYIKVKADELGVTSFKTDAGTAFLTTTDYANVAEWTAILDFIKENGAYDLLEKRVNKAAARVYMEQLGTVPPGINYGTTLGLSVRKPTAKD